MRRTSLMLIVVGVAVLSAFAGEGRIPIYQQTVLVAPGSYVVTRGFQAGAGAAILISAVGVTVDLNGHSISTADPAASVIDIQIPPAAVGSVRIRNGRLAGGTNGILSNQAPEVFIENVEIKGPTGMGIDLNRTRYFEVISCTIISPGTRGLNAFGGPDPISGRVVDNFVSGSPSYGIILSGFTDGAVTGNQIEMTGSSGGIGINIQDPLGAGVGGNLVARNRITHDGAYGLLLTGNDGGSLVTDNVVRYVGAAAPAGEGISSGAPGSYLIRNVVSGHRYGMNVVASNNHIEANKAYDNDTGLYFSSGTDNSYRGNVLVGNLTAPIGGPAAGSATDGGGNLP